MNKLIKYINQELTQFGFKLNPKENGREGVDFTIKTKAGNYHELYLQPINLETERSVKISKEVLGEPIRQLTDGWRWCFL